MGEIYQDIKATIDSFTFLSRDVLHVYGGVLFFMLWLFIFKKQRQLIGLMIISIAALINETLDVSFVLDKSNSINWMENLSDIFNTIFLPLLLFVFLQFWDKDFKIK